MGMAFVLLFYTSTDIGNTPTHSDSELETRERNKRNPV